MYRSIDTKFWTDPKVRLLTPNQKFLFLYLITSGHSHVSGIYYLPKVLIQHETGLTERIVDEGIDTLTKGYLIRFDTTTEVVWVRHMLRYQHHGEKIRLAVASQLENLHNCPLIKDFLEEYSDIDIPYQYPIDTRARVNPQEQDQEQRQDQEQDLPPTPTPAPPVGVREEKRLQVVSQKPDIFSTAYTPGFLAWWEEYPHDKRAAKPKCFAVWVAKHLEARQEELVEKLVRLKQTTWNRTGAERRYIKTALPYLNDGRYDDELMPLPTFDPVEANQISTKGLRGVQAAQRIMYATQEVPHDAEGPTTFLPSPQCYGRVLQ